MPVCAESGSEFGQASPGEAGFPPAGPSTSIVRHIRIAEPVPPLVSLSGCLPSWSGSRRTRTGSATRPVTGAVSSRSPPASAPLPGTSRRCRAPSDPAHPHDQRHNSDTGQESPGCRGPRPRTPARPHRVTPAGRSQQVPGRCARQRPGREKIRQQPPPAERSVTPRVTMVFPHTADAGRRRISGATPLPARASTTRSENQNMCRDRVRSSGCSATTRSRTWRIRSPP